MMAGTQYKLTVSTVIHRPMVCSILPIFEQFSEVREI